MGDTELVILVVIFTFIVVVSILGVIIFMVQFRKGKIIHMVEIDSLETQHKIDLLNTQIMVQKETMTEIGKELHDNLGQKVTLASIYLQQIPLKQNLETLKEDTDSVNLLLNEILSEMRRLSKSLVSENLENISLSELINEEAKRITQYTKINVHVEINCENYTFSTQSKNGLFRIFQEFAQNSIKHSNCNNIWAVLTCKENKIHLHCSDDGIGFDTKKQVKGIGLTNMNRRAIELGGELKISSEKGKGTQISFSIDII